jgi:chaperonin GroES
MAAANTKLPLKPIGGNILVRPDEQEETTPSGLVISATAKGEKPQRGTVLALGTGKKDKDGKELPWSVNIGDVVYFKKYSPDEIEVEGVKYLIMEETDLLAVAA